MSLCQLNLTANQSHLGPFHRSLTADVVEKNPDSQESNAADCCSVKTDPLTLGESGTTDENPLRHPNKVQQLLR